MDNLSTLHFRILAQLKKSSRPLDDILVGTHQTLVEEVLESLAELNCLYTAREESVLHYYISDVGSKLLTEHENKHADKTKNVEQGKVATPRTHTYINEVYVVPKMDLHRNNGNKHIPSRGLG